MAKLTLTQHVFKEKADTHQQQQQQQQQQSL
jgi:hypothetical protein